MTQTPPEFAPEYSSLQKRRRVLLLLLLGGVMAASIQFIVNPALQAWVTRAPCSEVFGFPGINVLWWFVFVGIAALSGFLVMLFAWPIAFRVMRSGQYPPPGMRVYGPTRIQHGRRAATRAVVMFLAPLLFFTIAVWGSFRVNDLPGYVEDPGSWQPADAESCLQEQAGQSALPGSST